MASLLWIVFLVILSALPLNLAVKFLGGKSSLVKVILVNLLIGFLVAYIYDSVGIIPGIISFVVMILVYRVMFDLGWIRALLAWLLQFFLLVVFIIVLTLIGISIVLL